MKKHLILPIAFVLFFNHVIRAQVADPTVTDIQIIPNSACLDSTETAVITIGNLGANLDLNISPLIVTLNVSGPSGNQSYTDTVNSGILQSNTSIFPTFNHVNLYAGGCYNLNAVIVSPGGNSNMSNDSLPNPQTICNSRPQNVDYHLCLGDTIPTGQGLGISNCPTVYVQDSVIIPFTLSFAGNTPPPPTQCSSLGAGVFASATLPYLPAGANILSGEISISNLAIAPPLLTTNPSLTRISLYQGPLPTTAANVFHNGLVGNTSTSSFGCFNYVSTPPAVDLNNMFTTLGGGNSVNMGHWSTNRCTATDILTSCGNPTVATLKIIYEYVPSGVSWFEQPSGGISISNASVLDPLKTPNTIMTNSNTPGVYTFYGACAADTNCRVASNITVSGLGFTNITKNNVSCNGDSSGSIQVQVSGGSAPYNYQLSGAVLYNQTTGLFTGLPAGTYTLQVTDATGCSSKDSVITIVEPAPLSVSVSSITNVNCNGGNDGSIVLFGTGGSGVHVYSLLPTSVQSTSGTFNNLTANIYTATIVDANNCTFSTNATITEPPALQITNISSTTPSCIPGNDATILVTANGGTGPLQYGISPWPLQASNVFTGLSSGSYGVTVIDVNGCSTSLSHNIINPNVPYIYSQMVNNALCNGDSNGSIQVVAVGGISPLAYSIYPQTNFPQVTGNFTGLAAGVYVIQAIDANNCSVQTTMIVSEPPPLTLSTSVTNSICNTSTGSLSLTGQGGSAPYVYNIGPLTNTQTTSGTFQNIPAGNYLATVSDANSCSFSTTAIVSSTSSASIDSFSSHPPVCVGDSNGWISVSASGNGPITYSMVSPAFYAQQSANGYFANLPSGNYVLHITDSSNCPEVLEVFLGPGGVNILNTATSSVPCVDSSGSIQVNAFSENVGPILYSLSPAFGVQTSAGNFQSLPSGSYIITATDAGGCTSVTTVAMNYPSPPKITNINATDVLCHGDQNGSFSFSTIGGAPPLNFTYNPILTPSALGIFTNLGAGTYYVAVTDSIGCNDDATIIIEEPAPLVLTKQSFNTKCPEASNGRVELMATGGTSPYNYTLIGGLTVSNGIFDQLGVGQYAFHVIDANGCIDTISHDMISYSVALATTIKRNETCVPGNDGQIHIEGYPIDTNYLYSTDSLMWSKQKDFTQLQKGTYQFFMWDTLTGCRAQLRDTLEFINNLPLNDVVVTDENCFKQNDGRITAPNTDYYYRLVPNAGTNTVPGIISNIPPGMYTLIGEKTNGCTGEKVVSIEAADSLWIAYTKTRASNVHCYGSVDFEVLGGTNSFTYGIQPKRGKEISPGFYDGLCWGDYTLRATDDLGCTLTKKITIEEDLNAPRNMFHHFSIYPNPTNDVIWLRSNYLFEYEVSLVNLTGQTLMKKDCYDKLTKLEVSHLASGLYILRFDSDVDHFERKVLIQH